MASSPIRASIVRAAGRLTVDSREPAFTFDRVAALAGVSRRTVFNHFATREALLAAGIDDAVDTYVERMPARGERDVDEWLRAVVAASLAQNMQRGGWYFQTLLEKQSEPLRSALRRRQRARHALSASIAQEYWRGRGLSEPVPDDVVLGFNVWLGAFAAAALRIDCQVDDDEAVDVVVRQLRRIVDAASAD
jgi:AcrR family transcriptional regulator